MLKTRKVYTTALVICCLVIGLLGLHYYFAQAFVQVKPYEQKDKTFILSTLRQNWYWLTTDSLPASDYTDLALEKRFIQNSPLEGKGLGIGVCRKAGIPVGFVTYYKQSLIRGKVHLLAVSDDYRGHGYGERLLKYALDRLGEQGCLIVDLITRTSNEKAQRLYQKAGFKSIWRDQGFIRYEKTLS
ncbi:MAG TPA: GNAT family N-acetyltransferase [Candidatus Babeliaceae bacterium]|nr:GNAT family N-acetyltransferase [Candidatus Babeliaceae bacterium]